MAEGRRMMAEFGAVIGRAMVIGLTQALLALPGRQIHATNEGVEGRGAMNEF